ncbi:phospholipid phosphatase 1-like [Convolutriloba macropyga]|uniref:phospholipid phosphatase 1-like n=1 Tax=Convolutriloba macropyga TaxID=536237 RepID=UPI003F51F5D5
MPHPTVNAFCAVEVFNCVLLLVLLLAEYLTAKTANLLPVFHRGFFCDDETIRYPYKDSTVPYWTIGMAYPAFLVLFMLPLVVIQLRSQMSSGNGNKAKRKGENKPICRNNEADEAVHRIQINQFLSTYYYSVTNFLFGFYVSGLLTNIVKHAAGRLRPNFVSVCDPAACKSSNLSEGSALTQLYVLHADCLSDDHDAIADSRRSFPSGHSSCAFYIFVFTAIYLQQTLSRSCLAKCLLLPLAQATSLLFAVLVAVSRVCDNKHHYTDVIAGALLGTAIAYFSTVCLPKMRQGRSAVHTDRTSNRMCLNDPNGVMAEKVSMHTIAEDDLT